MRAKKILRGANYRKYFQKTLFFKIQGGSCPLVYIGSTPGRDLFDSHAETTRSHSVIEDLDYLPLG
jgi:hypothetical protein